MPDAIGTIAGRLINPLIDREGGYVDHPADHRGATCRGIAEFTARRARYSGDMCAMSRPAAFDIYWRQYVVTSGIDQLQSARFQSPPKHSTPE